MDLVFGVWCLGFGILEFGILFIGFRAWDLKFENFCLEFFSLGIRYWDSFLRFGVLCLGFGILNFGTPSLEIWVWDLEIGFYSFKIWFFFGLRFGVWILEFGV